MISSIQSNYRNFIEKMFVAPHAYRLTMQSETTPFALCFAVFGYHLLGLKIPIEGCCDTLIINLENYRQKRLRETAQTAMPLRFDKPFMQLFCFTMSALHLLGASRATRKQPWFEGLRSPNIIHDLETLGVWEGQPSSGNKAMFLAVLHYELEDQKTINQWIEQHLTKINPLGFWGSAQRSVYEQFQNGYHQYEILSFFNQLPQSTKGPKPLLKLQDSRGHFAPYPGGGGCYDYDAAYLLGQWIETEPKLVSYALSRLRQAIMDEQNEDGGFAESKIVRPYNIKNLAESISHILNADFAGIKSRLYWTLRVLQPKHGRIKTHWTDYSRRWNESNLWDSWFRMQTIAIIDVLLSKVDEKKSQRNWKFQDYPGIGFYRK